MSSPVFRFQLELSLAGPGHRRPPVISACWDQAWHDLKLTTLDKRKVNRLYRGFQNFVKIVGSHHIKF